MSVCRPFAEMKKALLPVGVLLLCCVLLSSCGFRKSRMLAEQAVKQFHQRLDSGQYETIYEQADQSLKDSRQKAEFITSLRDLHEKLGKAGKTTMGGFQLMSVSGQGSGVALVMQTEFARGLVEERFVWRLKDGTAELSAYTFTVTKAVSPPSVYRDQPASRLATRLTSTGNFPSRFFFRFSFTIHSRSGSFADAISLRSAKPSAGRFSAKTLRA